MSSLLMMALQNLFLIGAVNLLQTILILNFIKSRMRALVLLEIPVLNYLKENI